VLKVLGIIPARGGSKGIPRKNIKDLCGKPLLAYTVESALASSRLTRTILSTEDEEIAGIGKQLGVDVPFMRPIELASDDATSFEVVLHAVTELEKQNEFYDAVCLLQPTSPLRTSKEIDDCIDMLETTGADSVLSVLPVPYEYNPLWVFLPSRNGDLKLVNGQTEPVSRRQDLPKALHREGSVYVTRRDVLFRHGTLYGSIIRGYTVSHDRSVNIDSLDDWYLAEQKIGSRAGNAC